MQLVWLPTVHRRSFETVAHTAISVLHRSLSGVDAALVFNAANAPLLPVIRARGVPVATHVDGLEWQRAKWGKIGRHYYRAAEALSVRWSDELIADAQGIADYYRKEFDASTSLISYGAPITAKGSTPRLAELNLGPADYHLVVARFEPENHVLEIVKGYSRSSATLPLIVVGSAPYSEDYTKAVNRVADDRVRFLGGIWDSELLDQLYAGALTYVHGHSVGGTNPSLLRAAGAGAYPIAYDVSFNREVLGLFGDYFSSPSEVGSAVVKAELNRSQAVAAGLQLQRAIQRYNWDDVAEDYERLCARLSSLRFPARRPSGGRHESSRNRQDQLVLRRLKSYYG
jgi:glycosyltransferase involved in cell wall biosynthesis